jgi:LCP family protein required for cell wall assembly
MAAEQNGHLLVHAAGSPPRRVELSSFPVRIGRKPGSQVLLRDQFVSATHAELVRQNGTTRVRDLGSTNGTKLNGRPLAPQTLTAIRDGDVLEIGSARLTYKLGAAPAPPIIKPGRSAPDQVPLLVEAPPRRRRLAGALLRGALLFAILMALLIGVAWALAPARVSVLVLGSDARPDELQRGERGRTDTVMVVVAARPPVGTAVISLPRDLWVPIPGFGEERINTAYAFGGPDVARRTVGEVVGVRLDRYLLIGLQGVRDIVDAAGGVVIDVETPIYDAAYPTDDYGTTVVNIPAGRQRMDGETALRYARTRHQDSDFGRIARQQRVLVALRSTMLQPLNWWRIPAVLEAVRRSVRTDLGPFDLAALALSALGSSNEPERLVIDETLAQPFSGADGAFLLSPTPALRQRVSLFLAPVSARVEVLNGTQTAGAAQRAAETLRSRGMQSVRYGDAPRPQTATTVEVQPGARRAGLQVASLLNLETDLVQESAALPADVDVRVILGSARPTT